MTAEQIKVIEHIAEIVLEKYRTTGLKPKVVEISREQWIELEVPDGDAIVNIFGADIVAKGLGVPL